MDNIEKRNLIKDWSIAGNRVFFVETTYYKALLYSNNLRLSGVRDIHLKPIETDCIL